MGPFIHSSPSNEPSNERKTLVCHSLQGLPLDHHLLYRYRSTLFQAPRSGSCRQWGKIIPRCGGHLIGYVLPHEGTEFREAQSQRHYLERGKHVIEAVDSTQRAVRDSPTYNSGDYGPGID